MGQVTCVARAEVIYAIVSRNSEAAQPGFFTPPESLLQAGVVDHPAGYYSPPHAHRPEHRNVRETCEFLYVDRGRIIVEVFDEQWNSLALETLAQGDCVVLMRGGHAVRAVEATRLVEVKQGPYPGDGNAKLFRDLP